MPLEHLFFPIDVQGEYEIWVQQSDNDLGGGQEYGIAWWAVGAGPLISGDFDGNGIVDAVDLARWQGDFGINGDSDADEDGDSDGADFLAWQQNFGTSAISAVPEPATWLLLLFGALLVPCRAFETRTQ